MGAQGPPHLPRPPGPAQPHAAVQSKKSWGWGGAEVGLLYLGISDEFEKLLVLARSLQAAVRGLAGLWGEHGSRVN